MSMSTAGTDRLGGPKTCTMDRNFLYVRGGVPPFLAMILESGEKIRTDMLVMDWEVHIKNKKEKKERII